jgi:hypothetical protein
MPYTDLKRSASVELSRTFPGGTAPSPAPDENQKFINAIYQDLLHRPADPAALQSWGTQLKNGTPRATVVQAICASMEADLQLRSVFMNQLFNQFLNRGAGPVDSGYFWPPLQAAVRNVVSQILSSQEYFERAKSR